MQVNLNQLYVFYLVAMYENFKDAAKALHVSPPAVTMQIKKLENQLGVQLFKRHYGHLKPTSYGMQILPRINDMFSHVKPLEKILQHIGDVQKNILFLGSHMTPAQVLAPRIMRHVSQTLPEMQVNVVIGTQTQTLERLINKEVHVGIVADTEGFEGLGLRLLLQQEMIFAVCPKNPLLKQGSICVQDFVNIPILFQPHDSGFTTFLHRYFQKYTVNPLVGMENINAVVSRMLIPNSQYGAFFAKFTIENELADGTLCALDIREKPELFSVYLAYIEEDPMPDVVKSFLTSLNSLDVLY